MSRGMGRGGLRGRGRGGSRGGASSESRFPANFENLEFKAEDPEKVFPEWNREDPPDPPTEDELSWLRIARSLRKNMENSPYYLVLPTPKKKDLDRLPSASDSRQAAQKAQEERARFVNTPTDVRFFPEELRPIKDPTIRITSARPTKPRDTTGLSKEELDKIEQEESAAQRGRRAGGGGVIDFDADAEQVWEDDGYDEEEMEEETDYLFDHYADDDGVDEGGEGGDESYY